MGVAKYKESHPDADDEKQHLHCGRWPIRGKGDEEERLSLQFTTDKNSNPISHFKALRLPYQTDQTSDQAHQVSGTQRSYGPTASDDSWNRIPKCNVRQKRIVFSDELPGIEKEALSLRQTVTVWLRAGN
jgi:hypothetical protein